MNNMQFSITIRASRAKVWDVLWQDATFREWAGLIDPGTYMSGELKQGSEVQFISAENGYGVTSKVEKLVPHEYLLFLHKADTQDTGKLAREDEWTGGSESYTLKEQDGQTTLTTAIDVPPELADYFTANYPKALERVKALAEA